VQAFDMWRTRRSCGKRLGEEWLRIEQTSDLEEVRRDSSWRDESRRESALRWKTSCFSRQKESLFPPCSIMNRVPNRSVGTFVPRGTFPNVTLAPKLFHVEQTSLQELQFSQLSLNRFFINCHTHGCRLSYPLEELNANKRHATTKPLP